MMSKKASVLVVDDDIRMLRMIPRILELEGLTSGGSNPGAGSFGTGNVEELLAAVDRELW